MMVMSHSLVLVFPLPAHDLEDYASYVTFRIDWLICLTEYQGGLWGSERQDLSLQGKESVGQNWTYLPEEREIHLWDPQQPINRKKLPKSITKWEMVAERIGGGWGRYSLI